MAPPDRRKFQVRCDAGSSGRFEVGTDTLSVRVGQRMRGGKEEEMWDSVHILCKSSRMVPSPLRCLFVTPTGKKQRQLQQFIRALRMTAQQRRVLSVISNRQDLADCTGRAAQSSQGLPNFISSFSSFGLPLKSLVVAILKGWQSRLYDYFQAVIGLEKSVPSTLSQHGLDSAANLSVSISRSVLIDCSDYRIRLYLEVSELKKKV